MKKTDRRVKYTRMVIRQSFVKLLKQKPISKITIKEICEEADINRATFYAHYLDQYDLLHQIENDVIRDVNQYLDQYSFNNITDTPVEMLDKILEYIKKNGELFDLLLLNANGDIYFEQEIIRIIGERHFIRMMPDREDSEYIFQFFASGAIGVIMKWLRNGMQKPIKELSTLILNLSLNGRSPHIQKPVGSPTSVPKGKNG